MCPHTQVYMCPHTAAYAFSPKLHMCPHAQIFMCLHTPASYYYICVLILLYMCPDATVYVLILLYMCPHTTTNVSAHSCLILPTPTASRPTSSSRSCLLFFLVSVFFWQLVAQLDHQGKIVEAATHYERSLAIFIKAHGTEEHPDVAQSLARL
jgi:hypothetical protein